MDKPLKIIHKMGEFSLRTKAILILTLTLGALGSVLVIQQLKQPRFEGHTMEWWLNHFGDKRAGPAGSTASLSINQLQSLIAFDQFDREGFDFLVNQTSVGSKRFSIIDFLTQQACKIQWVRNRYFLNFRMRQSHALRILLDKKHPLEWLKFHRPIPLNEQSKNQLLITLSLLQNVTNQQSYLIKEVAPLISKTDHFLVIRTLDALYEGQDAVEEIEPYLQRINSKYHGYPQFCRILGKHAANPGFARNKLQELSKNKSTLSSVRALLALGSISDTKNDALSGIKEILPTIPHRKERSTQSEIILSDVFIDLKLWQQTSSEIKKFATKLLTTRLIESKSNRTDEAPLFHWLIGIDPENKDSWDVFDQMMKDARPLEKVVNLKLLGYLPTESKEALKRLHLYKDFPDQACQEAAEESLERNRLISRLNH